MRTALGPRLFLRQRRDGPALWYIRDGSRMQSTGLTADQSEDAQRVLNDYAGDIPTSVTLPQLTRPETVYFLTCEVENFPIKIGAAFDVPRRLAQLQSAMPYRAVLLGTMPGGLDRERSLHLLFRESRLEGEWFARSDDLMALIKERTVP